jgi:rubrerythrin
LSRGDTLAQWPQSIHKGISMQARLRLTSFITAVGLVLLTSHPALSEGPYNQQTREDLKTALHDEAFTILKYTAFAEQARKEGKFALAAVLEQTATDESRHFMVLATLYGLVRSDWHDRAKAIVETKTIPRPQAAQDPKKAMEDEAFSVLEYKAFAERARKEGATALAAALEEKAETATRQFTEVASQSGLVREAWHNVADAIIGEYTDAMVTYN